MKARIRGTFGGATPQQSISTGLFMSALSIIAALLSAGALYATYLGTGDAKWSVYMAAAFCLCIAAWQASSFVVSVKLRRRLKRGRESAAPTQFDAQRSSPALNIGDMTDFVNPPSVTDDTTRGLEAVRIDERHKQR